MIKKVFKWTMAVGLVALLSITYLLWFEANSEPKFQHPAMRTIDLGRHYFVNDTVGVSPKSDLHALAFVISHSSQASALIDKSGTSVLVPADEYGLTQSENLPGWGASDRWIESSKPISIQYFRTVVSGTVNDDIDFPQDARIDVSMPWEATAHSFGDVKISGSSVRGKSEFSIQIRGPGTFWIENQPAPSDGFPITFSLHDINIDQLAIGNRQLPPPAEQFSLSTRDLHSLASGEIDGDAGTEFSVVRGGARGRIGEISPQATDILFDTDSHLEVTHDYPGFLKKGCPSRQSGWVDVDSDNDLDLYVVCGRSSAGGQNASFSNRLFLFDKGNYREAAIEFGIDFQAYGAFKFLDWDGDRDQDLWWAPSDGALVYFENNSGIFTELFRQQNLWPGGRQPQLLAYDIDKDGQAELLLAHPSGNHIVNNNQGNVEIEVATVFGLPHGSYAATWAHINDDDNVDLLTATDGIFFGSDSGNFYVEPPLDIDRNYLSDARLVSYAGRNQAREFLFAYRRCLPGKLCGARRFLLSKTRRFIPLSVKALDHMGLFEPYDWFLQSAVIRSDENVESLTIFATVTLNLAGPTLNPRSVGASVELVQGESRQRHWVGESESSLLSQADFSIYAKLDKTKITTGRVFWQDGCEIEFEISPTTSDIDVSRQTRNRVITVSRPAACPR